MATSGTTAEPRDGRPGATAIDDGPAQGHYRLSHLDALEAQAIHIFREVAAEFERPVLLFSGGKDSIVMLHLARKAFRPAPIPFLFAPRRYRSKLHRGAPLSGSHGSGPRGAIGNRSGAGRHQCRPGR